MPEVTQEDIWIFIYSLGPKRDKDIKKNFEGKIAPRTYYSYKCKLEEEGKIAHYRTNKDEKMWYVPDNQKQAVENIKTKRELILNIQEMDSEELLYLKKRIDELQDYIIINELKRRHIFLSSPEIEQNKNTIYLNQPEGVVENYKDANVIIKILPEEIFNRFYFHTEWKLYGKYESLGIQSEKIGMNIYFIFPQLVSYHKSIFEDELKRLKRTYHFSDSAWIKVEPTIRNMYHSINGPVFTHYLIKKIIHGNISEVASFLLEIEKSLTSVDMLGLSTFGKNE